MHTGTKRPTAGFNEDLTAGKLGLFVPVTVQGGVPSDPFLPFQARITTSKKESSLRSVGHRPTLSYSSIARLGLRPNGRKDRLPNRNDGTNGKNILAENIALSYSCRSYYLPSFLWASVTIRSRTQSLSIPADMERKRATVGSGCPCGTIVSRQLKLYRERTPRRGYYK